MKDFSIYFNRRKQWIDVFLQDVHPNTFHRRKNGRWAYFQATWTNRRRGKFGELHFVRSRLRFDTIAHEIHHAIVEWYWARGSVIDRNNEEASATLTDELNRKFIRELRKVYPKVRL